MSFTAQVFHNVDEARKAAGADIADDTGVDLYQTWAWFANLDRLGRPAELTPAYIVVKEGDSGRGLCLPLVTCARAPAAVFGPGTAALSTYYSSLFGPTGASDECNVDACRAIVRAMRQLSRASDILDLQPLDKDGPFFEAMTRALRAEGYLVDSYFCFGNWHRPCEGIDFEQYYATVPSRVRNTVQRHRKKLDKQGTWSITVHTEPGPALEEAIGFFTQVYNRSWKVAEPFPDFVPGLCRTAAEMGWLRLGVLRIGDAPAAAQLWLVRERKALIYKLAYDEAFSQFSPGSVLSYELFKRAIDEEKVVDIDYLTGDDGYKRDWMTHRRERIGIIAFRRSSPRALLSAARHRLGPWVRSMRQRMTTRAEAQAPVPAPAPALIESGAPEKARP